MKILLIITLQIFVLVSCGQDQSAKKENSSQSFEMPIEDDYNGIVGSDEALQYKLILQKYIYNTDEISSINLQIENTGDFGFDLSALNLQMRLLGSSAILPLSFVRNCNNSYLGTGHSCDITLGTTLPNDITSINIAIQTSITSGESSFSAQVMIQYIAGSNITPPNINSGGSGGSGGTINPNPVTISNNLLGNKHSLDECTSTSHRDGNGKVFINDDGDAVCQFRGANWDATLRSEITEQSIPSEIQALYEVLTANQSWFSPYNWCPTGWEVQGAVILKAVVEEKTVFGYRDVEITDPQGQLVCKARNVFGSCTEHVRFYPRLTTVYCI